MNVQRLQAIALILSAVILLLGLVVPGTSIFYVSSVIGILLFMVGIPAIYSAQPSGWIGLLGIILLELSALIALGFRLDLVSSDLGGSLSLISAVLGMLGAVIFGWITIRDHVFPAWVGWVFLVQGPLNFITGLTGFGSSGRAIPILISLLQAVALIAYGYFLYQI